MRSDLFTSPSREKQGGDGGSSSRKLTKRVSFETSTAGPSANGADGGGQPINDSSTSAQDLGYLRPSGRSTNGTNGTKAASLSGPPEMEQVRGNELAIVHEEESPVPAPRTPSSGIDREAGAYWMRPSREEIENMNRVQRQKVSNFTVGRENVGSIEFKFPVDLSNITLDELFGGIVDLVIRSATVYPNPAKKPPVGKGLNVPAIITLEQSWPRDRGKKKLDDKAIARLSRHVEKLKKIPDTIFESYDKDTGVWRFSVEHFTTYGLDDDDDDVDDDDEYVLESTEVVDSDRTGQFAAHASGLPDLKSRAKAARTEREAEDVNQHRSKRRAVPGAFEGGESSDEGEHEGPIEATYPSLYSEHNVIDDTTRGAVQTTADGGELDPFLYDEGDMDLEHAALDAGAISEPQQVPGGILRARMKALKESSLPQKIKVTGGDDWTEALRKRVNSTPRTDRAALRAMSEQTAMAEAEAQPDYVTGALGGGSLMASSKRVVSDGQGFATSIDLMNSLFDKAKASGPRVQASPARGFLKVGV
jgi:nuclear pore complex protein Nup98-Nup96